MPSLILSESCLAAVHAGLAVDPAGLLLPAFRSRREGGCDWLLHPLERESADRFLATNLQSSPGTVPAGAAGLMCLGTGSDVGRVEALEERDGRLFRLEVRVVGPGLPRLHAESSPPEMPSDYGSRTRGALGEDVWGRLRRLDCCLIGAGRLGSLLSAGLAGSGVGRLRLVDPDQLELSNLLEMDAVLPRQVGLRKAAALADRLRETYGAPFAVQDVSQSIASFPALEAVKAADLLVAAPDNPAARLAAAFLGAAYLRPVLETGAGIFHQPTGIRSLGGDVRLTLPGRCLVCLGGIGDLVAARRALFRDRAARQSPEEGAEDWRRQRAGSLRSLNSVLSGLAIRLLEDFIGGHVEDSVHLRLDWSPSGIPGLAPVAHQSQENCPICRYTGMGDSALELFRRSLARPGGDA